ncbi:hypothetical protein WBJ53_07815 [Spirosoma sp. SC4-14]|uniref:hypothetical protein n=1 Tax=Spirosoma sp. SC4-14 TaxID=3128900 RepID=UPI0030CD8956
MKISTQRLLAGLVMATMFTACSRPVAHFQPTPREHFAVATSAPVTSPTVSTEAPAMEPSAETAPIPMAPATRISEALDQMDALVRNDSKLASNKTVQKRLNRIRTLVETTATQSTLGFSSTNSTKKAGLMERMVLKKMNKKISRQLAPQNPDKTMMNSGILATGAVLVIVGLLLLLLTSGTGATVGLIVLLAGAVILLVGLL